MMEFLTMPFLDGVPFWVFLASWVLAILFGICFWLVFYPLLNRRTSKTKWRQPSKEWLMKMADAEDEAGCVSVGGWLIDRHVIELEREIPDEVALDDQLTLHVFRLLCLQHDKLKAGGINPTDQEVLEMSNDDKWALIEKMNKVLGIKPLWRKETT